MLNPQTFKEVFTQTIDFVVERIYKNYALQIMANSFLANSVPSPIFATILVEYLLERMHEMGSNMDRSNLYLKLFKLVFGSVSLFAAENEQMLKPHLHAIVNKSMDLAKSAKEPYNYFLLVRTNLTLIFQIFFYYWFFERGASKTAEGCFTRVAAKLVKTSK